MMLLLRLLFVVAFAFWQGGFTFYAAVVVPIGTEVLGSASDQARITRRVTPWINVAGAAALTIFALDIAVTPAWRRSRGACWLAMTLLLVVLLMLRPYLDRMFHGDDAYLDNRSVFRYWHRMYLWLSTVQWGFGVILLMLTLAAWRRAANDSRAMRA